MHHRAVRAFVSIVAIVALAFVAGTACGEQRPPGAAAFTPVAGPAVGAASVPSGVLLDGSFEQGGRGWELVGTTVVDVGSGAAHGTRALLFDPGARNLLRGGAARTRIETEVGREYRLTFAYQAGFERGSPVLSVELDGDSALDVATVVRFFDPGTPRATPARTGWIEETVSFFAQHPQTVLRIGPLSRWHESIGWGKVWVDRVRLEALPTRRELGRDLEVRATLPSIVQAGEEVELTVSLAGRLRRSSDAGGMFDLRPLRHTCAFTLSSDDAGAVLPPALTFSNQSLRTARVRFATPGVRRLWLTTADGFQVRSNPVRVEAAAPSARAYWGDVHVHTSAGHSDWIGGSGALNYALARDFADLDFAALSEHFDGASAADWLESLAPDSARFDQPGRFVTFLGVESFGYQGHTNHYLRGGNPLVMYDPRNTLGSREAQVENLRTRGARVLSIPHHFMLLDPADWRATDRGALRLAEIYSVHGSSEEAGKWWRHPDHYGFAYSGSRGARGHDYLTALARGHRVGVIACSDSHEAQPGRSGLTCVRSTELSRGALWDALYERACYATSGERILLEFEVAGVPMGGEAFLPAGTPLVARLDVHGQEPIAELEILQDGRVAASLRPGLLDYSGTFDLGPYAGKTTAIYARVRQQNEHRAWTSPVWIDPARAPNLVLENRDLGYDHAARELHLTARNHGDVPAEASVRLYSSRREPSFGLVDPNGSSQPVLLLRLEPVAPGAVRLFAALYIPRHLRRTFQFSGEIQVQGANPNSARIAADPRGMLRSLGNGRFAWSDVLGVEYQGLDSLSGQITDFELVLETLPDTLVHVRPLLDAAPLARVHLGSQLFSAPLSLTLPVGRLARTPPEAQAALTLAPFGPSVGLKFALPPDATYVAVLGASGAPAEIDLDDNSAALLVPASAPSYSHWPEYLLPAQADAPPPPPSAPEPDPCCLVGG